MSLVLVNEHADNRQHVIIVAQIFAMFAFPHPNMFAVVAVVVARVVASRRCCQVSMMDMAVVQ